MARIEKDAAASPLVNNGAVKGDVGPLIKATLVHELAHVWDNHQHLSGKFNAAPMQSKTSPTMRTRNTRPAKSSLLVVVIGSLSLVLLLVSLAVWFNHVPKDTYGGQTMAKAPAITQQSTIGDPIKSAVPVTGTANKITSELLQGNITGLIYPNAVRLTYFDPAEQRGRTKGVDYNTTATADEVLDFYKQKFPTDWKIIAVPEDIYTSPSLTSEWRDPNRQTPYILHFYVGVLPHLHLPDADTAVTLDLELVPDILAVPAMPDASNIKVVSDKSDFYNVTLTKSYETKADAQAIASFYQKEMTKVGYKLLEPSDTTGTKPIQFVFVGGAPGSGPIRTEVSVAITPKASGINSVTLTVTGTGAY